MKLEELPIKKRENITVYRLCYPKCLDIFYLIATKEGWKYAARFEMGENSELDVRMCEIKDRYGNTIANLVIDRTPLSLDFQPFEDVWMPNGTGFWKNVMPVPPFADTLRGYIKSLKET